MKHLFAIAVLICAAACDPTAKSGGEGASLGDEQRSQLGETCGTSLHCGTGLRCLDSVCRAAASSTLGEFHHAAGALALSRNELDKAIESLTQAVNQYEADKVEPPAELHCALGGALVLDRSDRTRGERAARALHRCVLGAPAGSRLRAKAMRDLALLVEVGLDPLLLARTELADAYLTKAPKAPKVDDLSVTAKAVGRAPRSRTFTGWIEQLGTAEVKDAVAACWVDHRKATRDDSMTVQLGFRYSYRLDEYDDFERSTLTIDEVAGGDTPAAVAAQCVRAALLPIADEYSKTGAEATWKAEVSISLGK